MSDMQVLAVVFVAAAVTMCGIFCVLLYTAIRSLANVSGTTARTVERRERDCNAMLLRLIEKVVATDPQAMAAMHAEERLKQLRVDAEIERESLRGAPERPHPVEELMEVADGARPWE